MKKLARTVSIKSTIPDYAAKEEDEASAGAYFVRVPCKETSERREEAFKNVRCTLLDPNTVDEVARGLAYASLAFTDEKHNALNTTWKKNPWHIETLKAITGSQEKAERPLSQILEEDMNLEIDEDIDDSGTTRSGQVVDVHGYIAHNDEIIVLAYRCSTPAFDWLSNVPTARRPWDIDKDFRYSGWFSGVDCLGCSSDDFKPCVNSEFYHSFLASLPMIKRNIEPLLAPDQRPRKLFVTGHSLGAGVATLAACYFMLEFDWTMLPHSLIMVTAGVSQRVII
jgi:Lipase (class 3)